MSTPLGHACCGVLVGTLAAWPRPLMRTPLRDAALFALFAQAPDLDFIPGIMIGEPAAFHHGISHSLGFAFLAGLVMSWVGYLRGGKTGALRWGVALGLVYLFQVLLDAVGLDTKPPVGVPLLWPFTGAYFYLDPPLFGDVRRSFDWPTILHNLRVAGVEALCFGLPALLVLWYRIRRFKNAFN